MRSTWKSYKKSRKMRNELSSSMTTFPRFKDYPWRFVSISPVADFGCEAVTALLQNAKQVRWFWLGLTV